MTISVITKDFSNVVGLAAKVVKPKAVLPILTTVHIETNDECTKIFVTGNSLELAYAETMDCKPEANAKPINVCVNAKTLVDLLASVEGQTVEMNVSAGKLEISSGGSKSKIATMSPDDFPLLPKEDKSKGEFNIPIANLKSALKITGESISDDESRGALTMVNYLSSKGEASFDSADGYQLSRFMLKSDSDQSILFPPKFLSIVANLPSNTVRISRSITGGILARSDNDKVLVFTESMNENFPNVNQIIGELVDKTITHRLDFKIELRPLMSALRRVLIFNFDKVKRSMGMIISLEITDNGSVAKISSREGLDGQTETVLPCEITNSTNSSVAIDPSRLIGQLKGLDESNVVRIWQTREYSAVGIEVVGRDDILHVIMPMNLE